MKDIQDNHDGYHTFKELYKHRHLLLLNLIKNNKNAYKCRKNADGTEWEGWFLISLKLDSGDISYHLPNEYWDLALCEEKETSEWDGHTPDDVLQRLENNLTLPNPIL